MDETLTTNAVEPTVIEGANTADVNTAGYMQVQGTDINDGSQVIESSTPMDNNVTYNNIPDATPQFDTSKDFSQNILQQAVQSSYNSNLDANSGAAMDQFLNQDYNYDHNEAGTYWVAGAINDVDTQMSFLNTLIREDMYDEMDLQKYYYDTTMATARAYASQKKKETAYGFYRAAQEKAIAEAQLTGWYMPAEGNYMLGQYTVAQNVLEDPDAPDDAKARAQRISGTVEKWFNANQISTRGIKCLNMMNYEENVRHNTIMGELQKEANAIAGSQNAASGALQKIQLRETIFDLEEYELQSGHNITKRLGLDNKDFLGHDVLEDQYFNTQGLQGFSGKTVIDKDSVRKLDVDPTKQYYLLKPGEEAPDDWLEYNKQRFAEQGRLLYQDDDGNWYTAKEKHISALANMLESAPSNYAAVLNSANKEWLNNVLEENGVSATDSYRMYNNDQDYAFFKTEVNETGTITAANGGFQDTKKKTNDGENIVSTVVNNQVVVGYFKDGVWNPITDENYIASDGTNLKDFINKQYGVAFNTEGINAITIDGETYGFGKTPDVGNTKSYKTIHEDLGWDMTIVNNWDSQNQKKVDNAILKSQSPEGYIDKDGNEVKNLSLAPDYMDEGKINEYRLLVGKDNDGKDVYYSVETDGELKKLSSKPKKIPTIKSGGLKTGDNFETGIDLNGDNTRERICKASYKVTYNEKEDVSVMAFPHSDGTVEYYTVSGDVATGKGVSGYDGHKVKAVGLSEDQVRNLGGKVLGDLTVEQKSMDANLNTGTQQVKEFDTDSLKKVSTSVSVSSPTKSGYEAQDTVEKRNALFNKYKLSDKEREDFDSITNYEELEEKIKNRYDSILGQGGKLNG